MKTLEEIVDGTRSGERQEYDDLRYAVLAMAALTRFDTSAFMRLARAERDGAKLFMATSPQWQWEEHFNRWKRASAKAPKEYVGWNNDPDNPEFQARRKVANKIMAQAREKAANAT